MRDWFSETLPYVEVTHQGGRQRPSSILIKTSWTTGDKGAANGIAQAWHNPNSRVESCHFVVDDVQTLRCVPLGRASFPRVEAFKGAVSICVCYDPPAEPTEATLANAAKLTARVCKRYHFPGRHIEPSECRQWYERGWKRNGGIVFDLPDVFPVKYYLELVQDELALL